MTMDGDTYTIQLSSLISLPLDICETALRTLINSEDDMTRKVRLYVYYESDWLVMRWE